MLTEDVQIKYLESLIKEKELAHSDDNKGTESTTETIAQQERRKIDHVQTASKEDL